MKKIYTLFAAVLFTGAAVNAQDKIVTLPGDSVSGSGMVYDEFDPFDVHLHVVNNTGNDETFMWYMTGYTTPAANWEVKLCDNNNCYDLLINPGPYESLIVPAGDTMDFKFQFSPHNVDGVGTANIVTYFQSDSAGSVKELFFKATIDAVTGINEANNTNITLYPNPVQNSFVVKGLEHVAGNLAFEVYNVAGKVVESKVTNADNSHIEISVATLPHGTYILKAFDAKGKTIATSRLNKVD